MEEVSIPNEIQAGIPDVANNSVGANEPEANGGAAHAAKLIVLLSHGPDRGTTRLNGLRDKRRSLPPALGSLLFRNGQDGIPARPNVFGDGFSGDSTRYLTTLMATHSVADNIKTNFIV